MTYCQFCCTTYDDLVVVCSEFNQATECIKRQADALGTARMVNAKRAAMSRPVGYKVSEEERAKISAGVRKALAEGRGRRGPGHNNKPPQNMPQEKRPQGRPKRYIPPPEFFEMHQDFYHRYGAAEAERLVRDHIAVVERRRLRAVKHGEDTSV